LNNDCKATGAKLGVGRSMVFGLWGSGALGSVTIGRRRFSTDRQIDQYLRRLERNAEAGAESPDGDGDDLTADGGDAA
jgi:hypothetical protein